MSERDDLPEYVPRSQVMQLLGVNAWKMIRLMKQLNIQSHRSPFLRETTIHRDDVKRLLSIKEHNLDPKRRDLLAVS